MIGIAWEPASGRRQGRAPNFFIFSIETTSKLYKAGTSVVGERKEEILLQDLETKTLTFALQEIREWHGNGSQSKLTSNFNNSSVQDELLLERKVAAPV
jgi:hypothetical protein